MDARMLPGMLQRAGIATNEEAELLLTLIAESEREEAARFFTELPRDHREHDAHLG